MSKPKVIFHNGESWVAYYPRQSRSGRFEYCNPPEKGKKTVTLDVSGIENKHWFTVRGIIHRWYVDNMCNGRKQFVRQMENFGAIKI